MGRFKGLVFAALLLVAAGCSVKEELVPEGGFPSYGTIDVNLTYGLTKASLLSTADGKTVVSDKDDSFRIYNVADASFVEVKPTALSNDGFTATLPLPYPVGKDVSIVVTYGGTVFRPDSTITASSPIEQALRTDGHDCSAMPMASAIIPLDEGKDLSVELRPLNALVEVTLTRIPGFNTTETIRNIHIGTTAGRGTRSNQLTCDAYCYKVDRDGFSLELNDYLSEKYAFDGEYAAYLELTSAEPFRYSNNLTLYFMSPGYVQPEEDPNGTILSSLDIEITTNKRIIKKEYADVSAKQVKFTAGRITSFTLALSTGTTSTNRLNLDVEWSPGYLVYDAATKGYGFAGPEERGLFFKLGSLMGFDPFANTPPEEYFGRSRRLAAFMHDDDGNLYYDVMDADGNVAPAEYYSLPWEQGTADMTAFRKDDNGDIVPFKPASYDDFNFIPYSEGAAYDRSANDPCAYVRDGKGDWRMPTEEEAQRLADVVYESLGNWRLWSYGEQTITTTDKKPHMMGITDAAGKEVVLSTTSSISHANSRQAVYKTTIDGVQYTRENIWTSYIELGYSENITIPTSHFEAYLLGSSETPTVGTSVLSVQSLTSLRCNYEPSVKIIQRHATANALRQGAYMVRCVRDK